jgi:CubicO group peptidase (beta-lactamase class C family)
MVRGPYEPLRTALRSIAEAQRIPGVAVVVVEEGEVAFDHCWGIVDVEAPHPVELDTRFPLASVSKVVTALAVHVEEAARGSISLTASPSDLIADLAWGDARAKGITLSHLLSHTAGLDDMDPITWADDEACDEGALARSVAAFARRSLLDLPGARYRYSNAGYDVAGLALARAAGTSFERAAFDRVLAPLAMTASNYYPHAPGPSLAVGHVGDGRGGVVPYRGSNGSRSHAPCGTLASSARDLAALVSVLADPARSTLGNVSVLARKIATTGRDDGAWSGLGVRIRDLRGETVLEHGGWDPGFRCAVAAIPSRRAGAAVLTNFHWSAPSLMRSVLDAIQGIEPRVSDDELALCRRAPPAGRGAG